MKVDLVSHSDTSGGAARAAYRLHKALLKSNIRSNLYVKVKYSDDYTVISTHLKIKQFISRAIGYLSNKLSILQSSKSTYHSLNLFGSYVFNNVKKSNADIINIHWINSETLSIKQISEINKPIILTLHDMWAFCGSEHLSIDSNLSQFKNGYNQHSIDSDYKSGLNLNYFIWKKKNKYWKKKFTIVTPSNWLTQCAQESILFSGWNVCTIPNTIDTDVFKPFDKNHARNLLNLPCNKKIIGFGAIGGGSDRNKGFDLLQQALNQLPQDDYLCVIFGQSTPEYPPELPIPFQYIGHLNDELSLVIFYNAIDVMVVPSRQEAFGQTASEAQSCGTPVTSFRTTGLIDVIEHKKTGYLASPFNTEDLAIGIQWCINKNASNAFSSYIRNRAINLWSYDVVVNKYKKLYSDIIKNV